MARNISLIIPTYNDKSLFLDFFARLQRGLIDTRFFADFPDTNFQIVIIDDGSAFPLTSLELMRSVIPAERISTYLVRHAINLGQGAALCTGIKYALEKLNADYGGK